MANDYKREIEKSGFLAFVPDGTSMWPILKPKKQTVIVQKKSERLVKFDVGFYTDKNGKYVLHRVMEVLPDGYVFMGDGQTVKDSVKEDDVFAVMTGFYKGKELINVNDSRYIKKVNDWYKNEKTRERKIKRFRLCVRIADKIKRVFCKKER